MGEDWEAEALRRIDEITALFESASGWGSWMVMAANERENLVDRLNATGRHHIEHKYQARLSNGRRTD